jgi:mono/diheme cytochrome c family protein
MTSSFFARPTLVLFAAAALGACHSGGSTTAAAPASSSTSPAASAAAARPSNGLPAGVTTAMVTTGDSIFHARSCRNCHGMDAKGARNGPDLTSGKFTHVNGTYPDFVRIITSGIPVAEIKDPAHAQPMPPRGGGRPAPLTDDQINAVAAYVYSLSHK